jgi:hypothetical protein
MGEKRNGCKIMVGRAERKRPLERPRRMWVGNIKVDIRKIGWGVMDWSDLDHDRD